MSTLRLTHRRGMLVVALGLVVAGSGCGRTGSVVLTKKGAPPPPVVPALSSPIDLPQVEAKPGTAIMILVDTSGSMRNEVPDGSGKTRPKDQIARAALERIIQHTAKWKKDHPDRALQVGICYFSSSVGVVLPIGDFDEAKAKAALDKLPRPNSGTAIGRALEQAAKDLYRAGNVRKHIVCITDGENTSGTPPEAIARQLHAQTEGGIAFHFVAFDTSSSHFDFLKKVNGHVAQAADGPQLQAELTKIYDQRILVEVEEPQKK